ncbi:hypothetical protein HZC07_01440, partial [Candidatus Micrarchaeota archaeon]|nr:hypothetical protein [Candidatus Micrarchaeota archaeon]
MKPSQTLKIAVFTDTYLPQTNGVVSYLVDSLNELSKKHSVVLFAPSEKSSCETLSPNFKIYWIHGAEFPFYKGYRMASPNYKRIYD